MPKTERSAGSEGLPLDEAARSLGMRLDEAVRAAARRLPLRFTRSYVELADPRDPDDPVRAMTWPDPEETEEDPLSIADPVGEGGRRIHPFVIRKHADRALLLVTERCHVYCRFCFRPGGAREPSEGEIDDAIRTLADVSELREVIISGGDPLALPDARLARILHALGDLPQLGALRIHTRAPVHDPGRIDESLAAVLAESGRLRPRLVIHVAHPRELHDEFDAALALLSRYRLPLLSQTVLLDGVNADPTRLEELFRGLYERGVIPYYLHHPDRVAGTARFRVGIQRGLEIYRVLRGRLAGPALPDYVLDLPDGRGKVPVLGLERSDDGVYVYTHPDGRRSTYTDIA